MGLDMYLTAKKYISGYEFEGNEANRQKYVELLRHLDIPLHRVSQGSPSINIDLSVGYWRKANAIHNWFVQNVQDGTDDCGEYYVDPDKLQELRSVCQAIKDTAVLGEMEIIQSDFGSWEETNLVSIDKALIEATLPPSPGFFFGSTEVDGYYYDMVVSTIEIIDNIIPPTDQPAITDGQDNDPFAHSDIYYQSSW